MQFTEEEKKYLVTRHASGDSTNPVAALMSYTKFQLKKQIECEIDEKGEEVRVTLTFGDYTITKTGTNRKRVREQVYKKFLDDTGKMSEEEFIKNVRLYKLQ